MVNCKMTILEEGINDSLNDGHKAFFNTINNYQLIINH